MKRDAMTGRVMDRREKQNEREKKSVQVKQESRV